MWTVPCGRGRFYKSSDSRLGVIRLFVPDQIKLPVKDPLELFFSPFPLGSSVL